MGPSAGRGARDRSARLRRAEPRDPARESAEAGEHGRGGCGAGGSRSQTVQTDRQREWETGVERNEQTDRRDSVEAARALTRQMSDRADIRAPRQ